jgi:hypothetical protein
MAAITAEILKRFVGQPVKLTRKPKMDTAYFRSIKTHCLGKIISCDSRGIFYFEDRFGAVARRSVREWDFIQADKAK